MKSVRRVFKKLLEEQGDDVSMVRLMCLVSLVTGVCIGLYGVYKGIDLTGVSAICAVFVGAAFTGKVAQKFAEKQGEDE